jgi:hypothetical protein
MALINCPECSNNVSDQATCCPSCGFPIPKSMLARIGPEMRVFLFCLSLVFLIGGILLLGVAFFLNSCNPGQIVLGLILFVQGSLNMWMFSRYRKSMKDDVQMR